MYKNLRMLLISKSIVELEKQLLKKMTNNNNRMNHRMVRGTDKFKLEDVKVSLER